MSTATIFDIKRFAVHDGDGIRTTVFFKGCPLRCLWCHNPEGLSGLPELSYSKEKCITCGRCAAVCPTGAHLMEASGENELGSVRHSFNRELCISCGKCADACAGRALKLYGKKMSVDELLPLLLEDREFFEQTGGGVTLSGGEALLQADFCAELLKELKKHGIHTAVDTSGAVELTAIQKVLPYTDIFLYDVKAADNALHEALTGKGNHKTLDNLKYIDDCGKNIEIRIPFIPGANDGDIENIGALLKDFKHIEKVKLLAYHHFYVGKYEALGIENNLPETTPPNKQTMEEAIACLKHFGLNAVDGNE